MAKSKVPNQRTLTVVKAKADKNHLYTVNNIAAVDEAAGRLQSKAGFKLYMYIAKNQDKYTFYLSSSDFMRWAGVADTAYKSAFKELVKEGYLIEEGKDVFTFYDKSQIEEQQITIKIPSQKVEEINNIKEKINVI